MLTATPFQPLIVNSAAVSVSGTTASGSLNIAEAITTMPGGRTCRVYNATSAVCFIKFGGSTVTATTADMPIPPGAVEVFSIGDATYIAGITGGGTGTLYATPGFGA
jgi:hypothetical protein